VSKEQERTFGHAFVRTLLRRERRLSISRGTWCVIITAVLLACGPARAAEASTPVLDGRWIYDSTKSRQLDPDLRIETAGDGNLYLEGGDFGGPYEFDLKGGSHALSDGVAILWRPISSDRWSVAKTRNGKVVESAQVTLRGNTLRTAMRGRLPDGSPYERNIRWHRQGRGSGLTGMWRSIEVNTGSTFDEFVISTAANGEVTWRIPTDLQVITGRLDGSDLPIIGPTGSTGATIALRRVGPTRVEYVIKRANRITERGTITVSADGHWLSELNWPADQPDRKSKLVYKRD
jgi:hypothetical protein